MKVSVYRNLHKGCFSVRAEEGPAKGLVILHAEEVLLKDVRFKVSEAGQARARREQQRNVHATVQGTLKGYTLVEGQGFTLTEAASKVQDPMIVLREDYGHWDYVAHVYAEAAAQTGERFSYHPYETGGFVTSWGELLDTADWVFLSPEGNFVTGGKQ